MDKNKTAVLGIYSSASAADRAVDALMQAGFSNQAIAVRLPDRAVTAGVATDGVDGAALRLAGAFIPEYDVKRYEDQLTEGGVLLSVVCDAAEATRAKDTLTSTGAVNIASTGEASVGVSDAPLPVAR